LGGAALGSRGFGNAFGLLLGVGIAACRASERSISP